MSEGSYYMDNLNLPLKFTEKRYRPRECVLLEFCAPGALPYPSSRPGPASLKDRKNKVVFTGRESGRRAGNEHREACTS